MTKPRPCGCKGCRTCLICETQFGADKLKTQLPLEKEKGYVYCPFCNKAWKGWDLDVYKQHPNHVGDSVEYPGVYIQLDFISEKEEKALMKHIDEMPWDTSQSGRRKQNFGPKTNFKKKRVVPGNFDGFPLFTKYLQDRFETINLLKGFGTVEQCSLEYDTATGASIDPHIDDCWIWGERIVTVNCLSDTTLTMTPYLGNRKRYNLNCAEEYYPTVDNEGCLIKDHHEKVKVAIEACMPPTVLDAVVRIPMPRRSLLVLYGEPRYHWEHAVLREDITSRRVCIAYRELTPTYLPKGNCEDMAVEIIRRSKLFWDHKARYNVDDCETPETINADDKQNGDEII